MKSSPPPTVSRFRELHESGCFVLPNPWNPGTAMVLEHLGFQALATTSAGLSYSLGLPDEVGAVSLDQTLDHFKEIVSATALPVNADFQNGFAGDPAQVARNVKRCVSTRIAGLSIEDATGEVSRPLYDQSLALERVVAAREAIEESGIPVVLTARCEAWLVGDPRPLETSLDRLVAFAEAGADCLYAPGVKDPREMEELVAAVAPRPVNVLMSSHLPGLTVSSLAALGVRRISVGSAMARSAWGSFLDGAKKIVQEGSFEGFAGAASFSELNQAFAGKTQ